MGTGHFPINAEMVKLSGALPSPSAEKIMASSQQVSGSSHFFGIWISQWEQIGSHQISDFSGVDSVIFDLTSADSFHVKRMSEIKFDIRLATGVRKPIVIAA
jgi:hypothetical protein